MYISSARTWRFQLMSARARSALRYIRAAPLIPSTTVTPSSITTTNKSTPYYLTTPNTTAQMSQEPRKEHIVIVGAGAWGASTAVALLEDQKYDVTLLDRASELPAADAASTDINKIVRFDYEDDLYAELAFGALQKWRQEPLKQFYHNSGTVVVALDPCKHRDFDQMIENARKYSESIQTYYEPEGIKRAVDPQGREGREVAGSMTGRMAYKNPDGGWVEAAKATGHLIEMVKQMGGTVVTDAEVSDWILKDDGGKSDVKGVKCRDGRSYEGDKVIVSAGAWSSNLLKEILPDGLLTSVGITVGTFKLDSKDYALYKDIPVMMGCGGDEPEFYSMPPTKDGHELKIGVDESGYTTIDGLPRTTRTDGALDWHKEQHASWIPQDSLKSLRTIVDRYFPKLADRPFDSTRMCPIPDAPNHDFIVDYASQYKSLLVATGGGSHSYKMLPIIGSLVRQRMEGSLSEKLAKRWAIDREVSETEKVKGRKPLAEIGFSGVTDVNVDGSAGIPLLSTDFE